ncbi:XRE family transcriptional regulator [Pollutimonas sp. H1-120]|uniref:XRE family transcriptional regulator n=1 Tax=Pollutimonas sp. H1-120 TaxID=3148824 RepID=UPI003B51CDCF
MNYTPPTPDDLQQLKNDLGRTGKQMAELACVGEQHWRKYTGGADPKAMPYPNLFHLAAQLTLTPAELERIYARMREIGAETPQEDSSRS